MNTAEKIAQLVLDQIEDPFRNAYWTRYVKRVLPYEKELHTLLIDVFKAQEREVILNMMGVNKKSIVMKDISDLWIFDKKAWNDKLRELGSKFFKELVRNEGSDVMRQIRASVSPNMQMGFDVENPNVKTWLRDYTFKFAEDINTTTENSLRKTLTAGMAEGENINDLAKRVRSVFGLAEKWRAKMIARTETIRASNMAAVETYEQSGVVAGKEWIVGMDERLCDRCREMDGKRTKIKGNFKNPDDDLTAPEPIISPMEYAPESDQRVLPTTSTTPSMFRGNWSNQPTVATAIQQFSSMHGVAAEVDGVWADKKKEAASVATLNALGGELSVLKQKYPGLPGLNDIEKISLTDGASYSFFKKSFDGCHVGKSIYIRPEDVKNRNGNLSAIEDPELLAGENIWSVGHSQRTGIFRHEVGHRVWFSNDVENRDKFEKLIDDNEINFAEVSKKISTYASSQSVGVYDDKTGEQIGTKMSAKEVFAESFNMYTHPKYQRGMLPAPIEKYLDEYVGSYEQKEGEVIPQSKPGKIELSQPGLNVRQQRAIDHQTKLGKMLLYEASEDGFIVDERGTEWDVKVVEGLSDRLYKDAPICINRNLQPYSKSFNGVLETGKLINQFEVAAAGTPTSGGAISPEKDGIRDMWENMLFGSAYQAGNNDYLNLKTGRNLTEELAKERPQYGYVDDGSHLGSGQYGNIAFKLKQEVKDRVTLSVDNSSAIMKVNKLSVCTAKDNGMLTHQFLLNARFPEQKQAITDYADGKISYTDLMQTNSFDKHPSVLTNRMSAEGYYPKSLYIEAQVHGGVDLKRDIEQMIVSVGSKDDIDKYYNPIKKISDAHGVPIKFVQGHLKGEDEVVFENYYPKGTEAPSVSAAKKEPPKPVGLVYGKDGWKTEAGKLLPPHIAGMKIPPKWVDVKVNLDPNADLVVSGKDSKGRDQRIYSEKHWADAAKVKFARTQELLKKRDSIIKENTKNLRDQAKKEDASCISLIMDTGIRPGSDRDTMAKQKAYGATTLEGRHVVIKGGEVRLQFVGKKGVSLDIPITNPTVADDLKKRAKAAGKDGRLFDTDSTKLLDYTHSLDGGKFKTKDMRTMVGTKTAIDTISTMSPPKTFAEYKKQVKDVAKTVSTKLGNTPTIALQSYIDPSVFSKWRQPGWEEISPMLKPPAPKKPKKYTPGETRKEVEDNWKKDLGMEAVIGASYRQSDKRFVEVFNSVGEEHTRMLDQFKGLQSIPSMRKVRLDGNIEGKRTLVGMYNIEFQKVHLKDSGKETVNEPKTIRVGNTFTVGDLGKNGGAITTTYRHEFGHHVFLHSRNTDVAIKWAVIVKDYGLERFKTEVSEYSGESGSEAFSECFSAFTSKGYRVGQLPKKIHDFMNEFIKKPQEKKLLEIFRDALLDIKRRLKND